MNYKKKDTSWFQTPVKKMLVKNGNFPQIGVELKKMKPPPRYIKTLHGAQEQLWSGRSWVDSHHHGNQTTKLLYARIDPKQVKIWYQFKFKLLVWQNIPSMEIQDQTKNGL